ncbi:hypothetical protein GPJ56_004940 [Histomonas meleagridis]|uniref:uncharacterized protein n=1 Tax=Histomonas meleagridis TaxID=135588 RepID=UPI0035599D96|nr:hypothetical protein GPJ56_004940 [Histomonas meleagridis]KAH0798534.1 hypothetical protein GO595_008399 [Histomonas meleagridis]
MDPSKIVTRENEQSIQQPVQQLQIKTEYIDNKDTNDTNSKPLDESDTDILTFAKLCDMSNQANNLFPHLDKQTTPINKQANANKPKDTQKQSPNTSSTENKKKLTIKQIPTNEPINNKQKPTQKQTSNSNDAKGKNKQTPSKDQSTNTKQKSSQKSSQNESKNKASNKQPSPNEQASNSKSKSPQKQIPNQNDNKGKTSNKQTKEQQNTPKSKGSPKANPNPSEAKPKPTNNQQSAKEQNSNKSKSPQKQTQNANQNESKPNNQQQIAKDQINNKSKSQNANQNEPKPTNQQNAKEQNSNKSKSPQKQSQNANQNEPKPTNQQQIAKDQISNKSKSPQNQTQDVLPNDQQTEQQNNTPPEITNDNMVTQEQPPTQTREPPNTFNNIQYIFNGFLEASFDVTSSLLTVNCIQYQIPAEYQMTTFTALGPGTLLFGNYEGIYSFNYENMILTFVYSISNVRSIICDQLSSSRFFILASDTLYAMQISTTGQIYIRSLYDSVDNYDISNEYKLIISKGVVSCYTRHDFAFTPIFSKEIDEYTKVYCDDNYYYEFSKGVLSQYIISKRNRNITLIKKLENIDLVFSSEEIVAFSGNKIYINDSEFMYHVNNGNYESQFISKFAIVNNGILCIWDVYNNVTLHDVNKSNQAVTCDMIRDILKTAEDSINQSLQILRNNNNSNSNAIGYINSFTKKMEEQVSLLENKVSMMIKRSKNVEVLICDLPQKYVNMFNEGKVENSFRFACQKSIEHLLYLCKDNRFERSLSTLSTQTLLEIAEVFIDNMTNYSDEIIPFLLNLLTKFDPKNIIVNKKMNEMSEELLSATLELFQKTPTSSPMYMNLRRLSHIAISYNSLSS